VARASQSLLLQSRRLQLDLRLRQLFGHLPLQNPIQLQPPQQQLLGFLLPQLHPIGGFPSKGRWVVIP